MKTYFVLLLSCLFVINCNTGPDNSGGCGEYESEYSCPWVDDKEDFFGTYYQSCLQLMDVVDMWLEQCAGRFNPHEVYPPRTTCVREMWDEGITNNRCKQAIKSYSDRMEGKLSHGPCDQINTSYFTDWCPIPM